MVYGVKLVFLHQPRQMRKFHGDDSPRLQEDFHAFHEIVKIGHLGQYVIAYQQIGPVPISDHFQGQFLPKKPDKGGNTLVNCALGHVCRRLDAQGRNSFPDKILKQVAVIAGEFDHLAPVV